MNTPKLDIQFFLQALWLFRFSAFINGRKPFCLTKLPPVSFMQRLCWKNLFDLAFSVINSDREKHSIHLLNLWGVTTSALTINIGVYFFFALKSGIFYEYLYLLKDLLIRGGVELFNQPGGRHEFSFCRTLRKFQALDAFWERTGRCASVNLETGLFCNIHDCFFPCHVYFSLDHLSSKLEGHCDTNEVCLVPVVFPVLIRVFELSRRSLLLFQMDLFNLERVVIETRFYPLKAQHTNMTKSMILINQ